MSKYTLAQILDAWDATYGEDMQQEYPGFIQRLSEENAPQASNPGKDSDTNNLGARTKWVDVQEHQWPGFTWAIGDGSKLKAQATSFKLQAASVKLRAWQERIIVL